MGCGRTELNYIEVGKRIRQARKNIGISQQSLAECSKLEPSTISHIERGATKLSLPTLVKIANALGVSADAILCGSIIKANYIFKNEINKQLEDCSEQEIQFISQTIQVLKSTLRQKP